jgi:hypothetical protein
MTVAEETVQPFEWEVSWANLYEGDDLKDVIGQAVAEMQDAVNKNYGATVLVIRNCNTGEKFVYDIAEEEIIKHEVAERPVD